tara:strand:- start:24185 stop:24631 length:447 start_codon:yes stop_codon:yes gene_type:complete
MRKIKKYNYGELDYESVSERSCYTVGKVYSYNSGFSIERGLLEGDLLLCIKKSGDGCYDFVRIEKFTETYYSGIPTFTLYAYFKLRDKFMLYGGHKEAFPNMELLSANDLVHVLYKGEVLIPLFATMTKLEVKILKKRWKIMGELNTI